MNLLCVLLTYLIETRISSNCSCEFNVVYVKRDKSQYLLYHNTYEVYTFKDKIKQNH